MTRLPTFIGIGAARCGTGSIFRYLGEHPDVFTSPIKETNYFLEVGQKENRPRVRSAHAYQQQFAGARHERAIGEFSPQYMNDPGAAERIAAALPGAKLIASLRNPADRAYSAWARRACSGVEGRPAEVALTRGNLYVDQGFYWERLEPYFELFPHEQIKIVIFEDLVEKPLPTMADLYRFLGVDTKFVPNVRVRVGSIRYPRYPRLNVAWQALRRLQPHWFRAPGPVVRLNRALLDRSLAEPPPYDPDLRSRVLKLYRDEVARMEELLGRELAAWAR